MISNNTDLIGDWVAGRFKGAVDYQSAIGLVNNDVIVAGVSYNDWNGASLQATIVVEGIMTPAYLAAIFHYPFIHLDAKKLIAQIAQSNKNSIHLVKNMGFRLEAQILDAHPDGSLLLYTMSKENCRFIGERYVKRLR
jgi:RimJ/RimL family protein N-acetyltransferase